MKVRQFNPNMITMPKWFSTPALMVYCVVFVLCTLAFNRYMMSLDKAVVSILSALLFFVVGDYYSREWAWRREKMFAQNVFQMGIFVRVAWVLYSYFFFNPKYYNDPIGETADVEWYMPYAMDIAKAFRAGDVLSLPRVMDVWHSEFDDVGYPLWLGVEYVLIGDISDVLIPMLIKCVVSAYCAVCIYHVGQRHYGEAVGRLAAIFVMLNPNMIYWCGTMFKEPEMLFLLCLFIDKMDAALNEPKLTVAAVLPAALVGLTLFLFRSALGLVGFAAVMANVVMASGRVMSWGKKVIAGILVLFVLGIGMGDRLMSQVERVEQSILSNEQQKNMEWRAKRKGESNANKLITKYATATIFAPLIFTIPFPTFNEADKGQILQQVQSAGNYIKNILSFFVILSMFIMLLSGNWRQHVFIVAITMGYLAALVLSNFAHSGRFHLPVIPMLMLFAAYGISLTYRSIRFKRWYTYALIFEVIACIGWNYFKLKGRGMV